MTKKTKRDRELEKMTGYPVTTLCTSGRSHVYRIRTTKKGKVWEKVDA